MPSNTRLRTWSLRFFGFSALAMLAACTSNDFDSKRLPPDLVPIDSIQIPAKFPTVALTAETLSGVVRPCLPWLLTASGPGLPRLTREIEESKKSVVIYRDQRSGNAFVMTNAVGYCIQSSSANLPILAAEAIEDTANASGVSPAIREGWHAQIARRLAIVGQTKVAYLQLNGNAYVVNYWLDSERPRLRLKYKSEFKRRGEWENEVLDLQFAHPSSTLFTVTQRGDERDKLEHIKVDLLSHRFKPNFPMLPPIRR